MVADPCSWNNFQEQLEVVRTRNKKYEVEFDLNKFKVKNKFW